MSEHTNNRETTTDTDNTPQRQGHEQGWSEVSLMLERAQLVKDAFEAFTEASDLINEGDRLRSKGFAQRARALRDFRAAGLSLGHISSLTGLSASRITSVLKATDSKNKKNIHNGDM